MRHPLHQSYPDYASRLKRQAFYHRNGFDPIGVKILEFGVMYDLLTFNYAKVSQQDFLSVMVHLIGEEMGRRYYGHLYQDCYVVTRVNKQL